MRRRAFVGLLSLLPFRVHAQEDDPFPLRPRPNPNTSCAEPFVRTREYPHWTEEFRSDLIVWAWNNRHLNSAYVAIAPDVGQVAEVEGVAWVEDVAVPTFTLANIEFRIIPTPPEGLPPNVLWMVMGDCGQLM